MVTRAIWYLFLAHGRDLGATFLDSGVFAGEPAGRRSYCLYPSTLLEEELVMKIYFGRDFIVLVGSVFTGAATTTDTTDSVRTSFAVLKNLYGMSVQVYEADKKQKEGKSTVLEIILKSIHRSQINILC